MLPAVSRGRNRRMRNSTMSRRALLRAAGAATIVAPCAPVTTQPGATQTGTTATTKPAGATGTLTFLWGGDTDKLDPPAMTTQEGFIATTAMYEGLVRYKPNSTDVEPALAERMPDISSDGLAYTFHLRSGIKFHDGSPLTAEAVAFSFDRSINKDNPLFKEAQAAGGFPFIDDYIGNVVAKVEAVGALDVRFTLRRKFSPLVPNLAIPPDRKSTRLNSSHSSISYAVFCLKKKKKKKTNKQNQYNTILDK